MSNDSSQNQKAIEQNEADEVTDRLRKLKELKEKNPNPFPNDFRVNCTVKEFFCQFESLSQEQLSKQSSQKLAGRVISKRFMGKAAFLHLLDRTGKIQIYVKKDNIGEDQFLEFKKIDLGDILGVSGPPFRTKTNELTVDCQEVRLLCKAIRPLPSKWHGLQDVEIRYRKRYLDLITNEDNRKIFVLRSQVIQRIREFFTARDYLEVETPMMQTLPGGATARPFITHHNALDMDLYLRIAPELYLKRLLVGGMERVFEINRNFRNEGISTQHNPEFTMLEFYQAYANYKDFMELTEELLLDLVQLVTNGQKELVYQDQKLNFSRPWKKMTHLEAIQNYFLNSSDKTKKNLGQLNLEDEKDLKGICQKCQLPLTKDMERDIGSMQAHLFEQLVESTLIEPTFITQYPVSISPLSRRNMENPHYTDRFELFIYGREIANAFSELNDPVDQRERFKEQMKKRKGGDDEAMYFDEEFLQALEHGMPPTAGEGIGIDRLVMILTNAASIREVILFPLLRTEKPSATL